jgi:transposase
VLRQLLPGGAARQLGADATALPRLDAELIAEIRHLDRRITTVTNDITATVRGTTLIQLRGIGDLTAAKVLVQVGDINLVELCPA